MTCCLCSARLTGGIDTFDHPESPLCATCWGEMAHERVLVERQYAQAWGRMNQALEAKDYDAFDAAYHDRYAGITDSPAGLRLAR